ncbi:MFS transporter [Nonomuraea mangrovi]|uniref:MFS transporter n=1 Tax=Nonomuraea mangrovi TaxID=2316207 RepID=A0ABW4STA4_9ACTN
MNPRRVLTLAQLSNAIGDGAYVVTSTLYFSRIVGLSPVEIGLGLTIGWAVGTVAGVPLGNLADRRGPRGVAVLLAVATAAGVGSFLVVRSFPLFVLAVCLYASAQTGLSAAQQALLAGLVPPAERTHVRAVLQSTLNGGLAAGAGLGGLALHFDTSTAYLAVFAVDAASYLVAAAVLTRVPAVPAVARVKGEPRLAVLHDRPYAVITLLNTVMLLYRPLISLVLPLWIVQRTDAPAWTVSAVLVLNTVCVVLFQVRVARRVVDLASASRAVRLAGLVLFVSCVVFSQGDTVMLLLAAALLQVLGEMMLASGAWEISFGLAPADKQGQYQGFFGISTAIARMAGPVLLTGLVIGWGTPGWLVLGGMFAAAGAAMAPAVRWGLLEAAKTQAVGDDEDAGEGHRGTGDHRVEQAERG